MQKSSFGTLIAAGFSMAFHCLASEESIHLSDTVVTATRSEAATDTLATASTVYTREDISQLQIRSVPELLSRTTGIDMTQSGGPGKTSSVFIRGTNSDHVLVLIDGIKVGSVTLGTTPFEIIPIDQIERVEISRGPHSSLYGSEAVGGVIQIFTRKGLQAETPSISLETGGGSYDTVHGAGSVSGKWQNSWYSLSASHYNTQGFNARTVGGSFNNPDRDGYYNTGLNARIGHRFDNDAEIEGFYLRAEGLTDIDGFQKQMQFANQVVGVQASHNLASAWRSTLRLGQSRDDNFNLAIDPRNNSRFDSTRWNVSWQNDIKIDEDHQMLLGSDYRLDEVDSTTAFVKTERYDLGIFGELHSRIFEKHHLNASLRWDENEAFGDYVTGNFGWRYNLASNVSAFASFGNAFKAPSLNDLYYSDSWGSHGDPDLKPEESTSFEIGLAGIHRWLNWEARAYHTDVDHLITWYTDTNTFASAPIQTQKAQIDGVELDLSKEIFGWNNKVGFEFLSPRDRNTNQRLARRADAILNYDFSRSFGGVDVGANVLVRGNSYEIDWLGKPHEVNGFATLDLRTAYHVDKHWILSAKLNNLLDKDYQLVDTYNTAGRNFFFSIHYNN